jgi:hypothetical protein
MNSRTIFPRKYPWQNPKYAFPHSPGTGLQTSADTDIGNSPDKPGLEDVPGSHKRPQPAVSSAANGRNIAVGKPIEHPDLNHGSPPQPPVRASQQFCGMVNLHPDPELPNQCG